MRQLMAELMLSELIDKIVRINWFLEEAGYLSVRPDEVEIIESFKETMLFIKTDLENVTDTLKDYHQSEEIPTESLLTCVKSTLRTNLAIEILHRFLEYIPMGTEIPPETYLFIDDMVQRFDFKRPDEIPFDYVLVQIPRFSFRHGKIFEIIKAKLIERGVITSASQRRNPSVIGIPKIEARNPYIWPILIHELGHAIHDEINFVNDILDRVQLPLEEGRATKNWICEFFADLISIRLLGAAYFISFLSFSILRYELEKPSPTHPSTADRIEFIRKKIEKRPLSSEIINHLLGIWEERYKLEKDWPLRPPLADIDRRMAEEVRVNEEVIANSIAKIEKILDERITHAFAPTNFETSKKLAKDLSRGIPISSSRKIPMDDIKSKLADYIREKNSGKGNLEELLEYLDEKPNDFTEIISAACIHKHEHLFKRFQTIFLETEIPFEDKCNKYRDDVLTADEIILKSIVSAAVHHIHEGE